MLNPDSSAQAAAWHALTRLGEAQILLPAMLLAAGWLAWRGAPRLALAWLGASGLAAVITTASKVAFLGYGIGWAALDFTGFSGHAMFAAAVLPLLLQLAAGRAGSGAPGGSVARARPRGPHNGLAAGFVLAGAVAVSRVMVGAHSWSEVVAGAALGAISSGVVLASHRMPAARLARWLPVALVAWGLVAVAAAPPSTTHDLVTRLALAQSGRTQPYHRWEMQREYRLHQLRSDRLHLPNADRTHPPGAGLAPGLGAGPGAGSLQPR